MTTSDAREDYAARLAELTADVWFEQKYPDPGCPARVLRSEFMRGRSIWARPAAERKADDIVTAARAAALADGAKALLAVDRVEWALAGQHAGDDAAAILLRMAAETTTPTSQEG
jgi:hypothetical protein